MNDIKPIVKYSSYSNAILFPGRIGPGILPDFAAAIHIWQQRKPDNVITLDFSHTIRAFANGMLGIIAMVSELRRQGVTVKIILPRKKEAQRFFTAVSWTHLLDPLLQEGYKYSNNHFVEQYHSFAEIPPVVNHFMDIIMGHIQMPKDVLAALEWSITEICDNVINHAESAVGGFIQVVAFPENNLVGFTVADAGKGILESLKEGIPMLADDLEAIQQAVKAGVTRNKSKGQGNGLTGTTRIATMTGGSIDIITGCGRLILMPQEYRPTLNESHKRFDGTCVSGIINMSHEFSIVEALPFGAGNYVPYTIIDAKYELENENALHIRMAEQLDGGAGSREAGKELRNKVFNMMTSKPSYPIYVNWDEVTVVASSFADEFLGKLFIEIGKEKFEQTIRNTNMEEILEHIVNKAITERIATG